MRRLDNLAVGMLALAIALLAVGVGVVLQELRERARDQAVAEVLTGGQPDRAPPALIAYGCAGCHTIPHVSGADGLVGPPLAGLRKRVFIGGVVRNTGQNLVQWIVDPHSLSPNSAMPATGISVAEARDVAAFLYGQ